MKHFFFFLFYTFCLPHNFIYVRMFFHSFKVCGIVLHCDVKNVINKLMEACALIGVCQLSDWYCTHPVICIHHP